MNIVLLVPDLFPRDGVGNDVLGMAGGLRRCGHSVTIVCVHCATGIEHTKAADYHARLLALNGKANLVDKSSASRQRQTDDESVLIYHYAVEWPLGDAIYHAFTGRRILRYHNVTPPELFAGANAGVAEACRRGRVALKHLPAPDLLLADSSENARDYFALTDHRPPTEVLPPFSQTEVLLQSPSDPVLESRLQTHQGLRLLFVGRITPHKNVAALIDSLDSSLTQVATVGLVDAVVQWFKSWLRLPSPQDPVLFIAGSLSSAFPAYNRRLRQAIRRCKTLRVVFVKGATASQLAALYRNCDLFITASLHEGFCVPVAEAMAFNLPLVLPDAAVFHETSAEQALFYHTLSERDLHRRTARTEGIFYERYAEAELQKRLCSQLMKSG